MANLKTVRLALGCGLALAMWDAATASAAVPNRLYIKQNGTITFAIDTSGNVYSRAGQGSGPGPTDPGIQFRWSGTPYLSVLASNPSDPHQLGTMMSGSGNIYENFAQVPYQPSGTLVFYFRSTPTATKVGMLEVDNTDGSLDIRGNYDSRFAYRQSTAHLKPSERQNLIAAWQCTDGKFYPGSKGGANPSNPNAVGGVSYWDKQQQIHYGFGEHSMSNENRNPGFLPWHRDFIGRFEALLRGCDPLVSLTYWDWTREATLPGFYDGVPLLNNEFDPDLPPGWFGNAMQYIGAPFTSFYSDDGDANNDRENTHNPADPPGFIQRFYSCGFSPGDDDTLLAPDIFEAFLAPMEDAHGSAHMCFNGNMSDLNRSPEDPAFFLVHSNVDRLWATWQRVPGKSWRVSGDLVYGDFSPSWPTWWPLKFPVSDLDGMYMGTDKVDPWSGGPAYMNPGSPLRPWTSPDNQAVSRNYNDAALTTPALYEAPNGWDAI